MLAPARLIIASAWTTASCQGPGSVGSPSTRFTPCHSPSAFEMDRVSTVISCPRPLKYSTRAAPTNPVPPVTNIFIGLLLMAQGYGQSRGQPDYVVAALFEAVAQQCCDAQSDL